MFKLLIIAAILALSLATPVPKPLTVTYTDTHLTPTITEYSSYPTVHNYPAVQTYSSPLVGTYTGYNTPIVARHTLGSSYYVNKYHF